MRGLFAPVLGGDAPEFVLEIAALFVGGRPGTFRQGAPQPGITPGGESTFILLAPLWLFPGHTPAQELKCFSEGNWFKIGVGFGGVWAPGSGSRACSHAIGYGSQPTNSTCRYLHP